MGSSAAIITIIGDYYQVQTCGGGDFNFGGPWDSLHTLPPPMLKLYPQCVKDTLNTPVVVNVNKGGFPEQVGASLGLSFGMALCLATILHALGVVWYLWPTPTESVRLRVFSYERQLKAGFMNLGSARLMVDRFGDARLMSQ